MTSDRWPKRASLEVALERGPVRLCAQAKGAGMLSPNFATMLCFVQTDAAVDAVTLDRLLRAGVERSFERVSVDGQLSTNDSVFAIAGGASGVPVEPGSDDERAFAAAFDALLRQLAVEMVADGEGAERVARLVVQGAVEAVDPVARAVANSPLVKCALHGRDPNWGRILQAAGQAVPDADLSQLELYIDGVHVANAGGAVALAEDGQRRLRGAMSRRRGGHAARAGPRRRRGGDLLLRPGAGVRAVQLGVHDVSTDRAPARAGAADRDAARGAPVHPGVRRLHDRDQVRRRGDGG